MERRGNKVDIVQRVSCWISDMAFARFKSFSDRVLGIQIDEIPTVESILMRQNFSVVFYAAILFILTNGIYLVKNIAARSMIPIDMVPLYMMIGGSLAMLVFTIAYKKRGGEYDAPPARFALLAYYGVVIASVTVFMVSCNFHRVGLSISMCYLFAIMIAPTYRRVDTVAVCVLILISWWLPGISSALEARSSWRSCRVSVRRRPAVSPVRFLTRCAPRLFQERTCRTGTLLRPLSVLRAGQAGN